MQWQKIILKNMPVSNMWREGFIHTHSNRRKKRYYKEGEDKKKLRVCLGLGV